VGSQSPPEKSGGLGPYGPPIPPPMPTCRVLIKGFFRTRRDAR